MTTVTNIQIAPLWRRLAAMIYDGLVVCAITMAYGFSVIGVKYGLLGATLAEGEKAQWPDFALLGLIFVIGLFFCFFWRRGGQTVGMKAWRLRAETLDGRNLNWQQGALRYICANLSFWLLGSGYWWQLFDKSGTLHDKLSASRVVLLEKSNH